MNSSFKTSTSWTPRTRSRVDPVPGTRFETCDNGEPSERGIGGIERMRLVRDDIAARVADLLDRTQDLRPLSPNRLRWRWISCLKDDEIRGSRNSCRCHRERHTARCGRVAVRLIGREVSTAPWAESTARWASNY